MKKSFKFDEFNALGSSFLPIGMLPFGSRARVTLVAVGGSAVALLLLVLWRRRQSHQAMVTAESAASQPRAMPHAHIISLARLKAARAAVLARAAKAGLSSVSIFEAVDGRELNAAELARLGAATYAGWQLTGTGFRFFDRELKWGEVGCALSHVGVWTLVAAQADVALVLEDDVDFAPDFADRLRAVLNEIAALVAVGATAEPDAIYLGRRAMRPEHDKLLPRACQCASDREAMPPSCPTRLLVPGFSYKTTAYLLWPRGARKLLASGYAQKIIPVDDFLALTYSEKHEAKEGVARPDLDALFAQAPRIQMLAVRPQLCWERRGISSTENSKLITDES